MMKLSDRIELPQDLDKFFDHLFGQTQREDRAMIPRTNIVESETAFELFVELPGVDPAEVNVEVSEGRLTISGEKSRQTVDEQSTIQREERVHGKFERNFEFPTQVDFDKIEASSIHGVLCITVPKSEQVLPRKIKVKVK